MKITYEGGWIKEFEGSTKVIPVEASVTIMYKKEDT